MIVLGSLGNIYAVRLAMNGGGARLGVDMEHIFVQKEARTGTSSWVPASHVLTTS
jgi:hypothetical protein